MEFVEPKKPAIVWFTVPRRKRNLKKVENLLKVWHQAGGVVIQYSDGEIMVVRPGRKDTSETIPARFYTVVLTSRYASVRTLINALWEQKIIPSGRQWMITYIHARKRDLDRLNLDKNGYPKQPV